MFEDILQRMRERVRTRRYVMTIHAEEEMTNDSLTIYDVEHCILTGHIIDREMELVTPAWKYNVSGYTVTHEAMEVVAKLSPADQLVIITVYIL